MPSGPDLFVVCKSCGSEVSPYITECPYCGTRLRKRAPKLEKGGTPKPPKPQRSRPSLGRLRPGEIPGIRVDRRPYATMAIVLASVLATLAMRVGAFSPLDLVLYQGVHDQLWRAATTLFIYLATGYEIVTLATVFFFGWLLERRHGPLVVPLVFLITGAGGMLVAMAGGDADFASGANSGALGLIGAWAMRDILGRRRGREDDSDLLGVLAIAVVMVCIPLVAQEASALAGVAGGVIGVVLGLGLARLRER
jgi:membrane associated rhomboid family serine protease